jgi:hypothetical protein
MRKQAQGRNPVFAIRWFPDEVIVTCVRWYLKFRLSYRDLACLAAELGVALHHLALSGAVCGGVRITLGCIRTAGGPILACRRNLDQG